jgi:hypothetical protein
MASRKPAPLTDAERATLLGRVGDIPSTWGEGARCVTWAERRHTRLQRAWGLRPGRDFDGTTQPGDVSHIYWDARLASTDAVTAALVAMDRGFTARSTFRARGRWLRLSDDWCRAAAHLFKLAKYDYEPGDYPHPTTPHQLATWAAPHLNMENGQ